MFYRSILHHRQFRYLGAFYLHSLIRLFAISIFQIFTSIYIFQVLRSHGLGVQQGLAVVVLFFSLIFIVHAASIVPTLWLISKKGLRFSVFWGNLALVVFFVILYISKYDPILLILAAVLGGFQIGLYWTAYHIYFTELTDDKKQGEEIALSTSLSAIAAIGGPAFGGLIINYAGYGAAFLVMMIIVSMASLPLKYLPRQRDIISVDILETVKALAPRQERRSYLALLGIGIADSTAIHIWPLYVFSILGGFIGVGFMGSLVAFIASVTTVFVGLL